VGVIVGDRTVVVGDTVGDPVVGDIVVGEADVGKGVVGGSVVGAAVVGDRVVGNIVGDRIVGDTVVGDTVVGGAAVGAAVSSGVGAGIGVGTAVGAAVVWKNATSSMAASPVKLDPRTPTNSTTRVWPALLLKSTAAISHEFPRFPSLDHTSTPPKRTASLPISLPYM
jgi:hypothetical protein